MTKQICRFILFAMLFLRHRQLYAAPLDPSRAQSYLAQFGHLTPPASTSSPSTETRYTESSIREAILSFQELAGLPLNGELDSATLEMMGRDRCAVADNVGHSSYVRRRKRRIRKRYVAQGSRWPNPQLLYFFQNTTKVLDAVLTKQIVRKAFNMWSSVSTIVASETLSQTTANIRLLYAARTHNDAWPFDGKGGVLAHAFFPDSGGDAHFDDDESWSDGSYSGTNLLQVTTHELGHSLGLGHSSEGGAVMAPFYNGYNPSFGLGQDDINGIRYLYGNPDEQPSSSTSSVPISSSTLPTVTSSLRTLSTFVSSSSTTTQNPRVAQFCSNGNVDAIVSIGIQTYAFQGDMYAVLNMNGIASGYPRYIRQEWPDLPDNLDAALYLDPIVDEEADAKEPPYLFFFKGSMYWRYSNTFQLNPGYPKQINEGFPGIPDNLDASFVWSGNGKIYFIKGSEYYRYTRWRGSDSTYPRTLAVWRGLPQQVDAAFQWTNGRTYFFSGTEFYRFDDVQFYTDDGYPKPIGSSWFGCPGSESGPMENLQMEQQQAQDQFYDVSPGGLRADPPSSGSSTSVPHNLEKQIQLNDDDGKSGTGSHSFVSRIHLGIILLTHTTLAYLLKA